MDNTKYYYQSNGEARGPISADKIKALLDSGLATMDTMVAKEGDQQWVELGTILEQLSPSKQKTAKKHHWVMRIVVISQLAIITCLLYNIYTTKTDLSRIEEKIESSRETQHPSGKSNKTKEEGDAINKYLYNLAVQQIDKNYNQYILTLERMNRKAHRELDLQTKLLGIESDKNRKILIQRRIRGEITSSMERDEVAAQDAKDAEDARMIERKRAEEDIKTANAKAGCAEERLYQTLELRRKTGKSEN